MFFYKFRVALVLLLTVVPAGCLPLMTVGAVVSEVRTSREPVRGPARGSIWVSVVTLGAFLLLALWSNLRLVRLVRRVRAAEAAGEDEPFEMSRGATWALIGVTYGLGVFCGAYFLMLFSTL